MGVSRRADTPSAVCWTAAHPHEMALPRDARRRRCILRRNTGSAVIFSGSQGVSVKDENSPRWSFGLDSVDLDPAESVACAGRDVYMNSEARAPNPLPPPPRSFAHASYVAAARTVLEATRRSPGFVLLTGAAGTGKTTLVQDLAAQLEHEGFCVGPLAISRGEAPDLLQLAGCAFGLNRDWFSGDRLLSERVSELANRIASASPPDKPAILIIDDAQDLAPRALPELCYLAGLTGGKVHPVLVLLSGRDQVWELLDRPDHAQIRQRILAGCRLYPLSLEETRAYVAKRLERAGRREDEPGITADALRLLHARTGGVLRAISLTLSHLPPHGRRSRERVWDSQDVEALLAQVARDHPGLLAESPAPPPSGERVPTPKLSAADIREPPAAGEPRIRPKQRLGLGTRGSAGDELRPRVRGMLQRWIVSRRAWVLAGLTATTFVAYFVTTDFIGIDDDSPQTSMIAQRDRGEASPVVAAGWMGHPVAEGAQRPPALMPVAASPADSAWPGNGAAASGAQTAPVTADPTIAGAEEAESAHDDALTESTAGHQEIPGETAGPNASIGVEMAGQDRQDALPGEVEALLTKAELALSKNRLMVPDSDNAYGYYQGVLALDPANEQAQAGVQRIVKRYRELAKQSLNAGDRPGARRLASRGLTLAPQDRDLLAIQRRASRARAPTAKRAASEPPAAERESPSVLDRVEAWLRSGDSDQSHFLDL